MAEVFSSAYDAGRDALEALRSEYAGADRNEATTRLQLIDRLFFECLGWSRDDCVTEEAHGREYADYTFSVPTRLLIVEAKKEGIFFEIPAGVIQIEQRIPSLMRDYRDVGKAIQQAAGYCQSRGVKFGAVANGHQLIVFIAARDDSPPLEGRALVFNSLDSMVDNFLELWNAVSKSGVSERQLVRRLAAHLVPTLPPKLAQSIPGYPGTKARNPFQTDLQIVSELVLEDIAAGPELEPLFLQECYCESGALSEYSMISRHLLQARYAALFDASAPGPTTAPATTRGGSVSEDLLAESLSRRPILIIGDVGVGKTTFLRHLMKVDAADQFENAMTLHINLGSQGAITSDLRSFVIDEIAQQLREAWEVDIYEDGVVRAAHRGDIKRFERGVYARLRETAPTTYVEKEVEFLAELVRNRTEHLRRVIEHIAKGRRKQIVLFLDNADQRDFETQQRTFLMAQEFAAQWMAMVFVTLRPETFHQSLRAGGALSGYHPKAFTIAPPRIDKVIERRLNFGLRITSGDIEVPGLTEVRISLSSLDAIMRALLDTIKYKYDIGQLIDNISSGNVRLALDLVRGFFGSGHVNTQKIVDIYNRGGSYTVPIHEFVRAVVYGDQVHYDPTRSYIANLFDIESKDPREHFLLPMIVADVAAWQGAAVQNGFVETTRVYERFQGEGFTSDQIDAAVTRAHRHRLIEAGARRSPKPGLEMPPSIRTTAVGAYHVTSLTRMFTYIDAIIVDTPILDDVYRREIRDAETIEDRLDRAKTFIDYLDIQWAVVGGDKSSFSWSLVSEDVGRDMERAHDSAKRTASRRRSRSRPSSRG